MEVEIRDAAADLKAYKYRRRSSFPFPKKSQKRISTSSSLYYYVNSILGVEQQRLLQP